MTDSSRTASCTVEAEDVGERADVVLGRRIPGLSRRVARDLARAGKLRVDGRRCPPATRVALGQRLELELGLPEDAQAPGLEDLQILATTARFVYVHKPAGVHAVARTPGQPGILATAVASRFPDCAGASEDPREGGAVHRLDRPTSGVVAFARSREIWARARAGFAEARVTKHYLAVSVAAPETAVAGGQPWPPALPADGLQGWIEPLTSPILMPEALASWSASTRELDLPPVRIRAALAKAGPTRSAVRLDGRRARTIVAPLARRDRLWLLHLGLETGRRHQARVHLAWIGLPIQGDTTYAEDSQAQAPASISLHACAIDLSGVFSGEGPIHAPPPPNFWPV